MACSKQNSSYHTTMRFKLVLVALTGLAEASPMEDSAVPLEATRRADYKRTVKMLPTLETPDSSRRPSLDSIPRSQGTSPSRGPQQQRRNRAALRDYYNLKSAQSAEGPSTP